MVIYGHIVKMHYFFKNILYSCASSRQTEYIVMMSKEASTKIVNFKTPGAGVPMMGCGHISQIVKMHYFFKISFSAPMHRLDKLSI